MFRRLLESRMLLAIASVALIIAGVVRYVEIRTPNRSQGSWEEIRTLSSRDDLNVVFILLDTLRADRLSAYGYERPTSPILEGLAATGIRFADTLAQSSWTKSSMASIWSSTYPATNRITRYPHGLPDEFVSPAELLREAGYRTVGIWRNGWVAPNFGFQQGFDLYFKPTAGNRRQGLRQNNPSAYRLPGTDYGITEAAMEFLRGVGDEKFFLYAHYMDIHQYVYDDSADFGTSYSDIYDNSIRWVDANVGSLVSVLQEEELMERTLFVVASDHGEAFFEHGKEGHARDLYFETTNVPFLIALPFRLPEGIVVETPVENVDIWPTILDLLGLPELHSAEGESLVPLIEEAAQRGGGGAERDDTTRFAQLDLNWGRRGTEPQPLVSVQEGRYRLFQPHSTDTASEVELYDREADPSEQTNLADDEPETVERLQGLVKAHLDSPEPQWGPPQEVPLSDMLLGQLRALGYVVGQDEVPLEDTEGTVGVVE
jgi:arylsulfatase A-like enzyme